MKNEGRREQGAGKRGLGANFVLALMGGGAARTCFRGLQGERSPLGIVFSASRKRFLTSGKTFSTSRKGFSRSRKRFHGSRTAFPRGRTAFPRGRTTFPRGRTTFPRARTTFPRARTAFPRGRTTFPRARTAFPRGRTTFPRGRTAFPRGRTAFLRAPSWRTTHEHSCHTDGLQFSGMGQRLVGVRSWGGGRGRRFSLLAGGRGRRMVLNHGLPRTGSPALVNRGVGGWSSVAVGGQRITWRAWRSRL